MITKHIMKHNCIITIIYICLIITTNVHANDYTAVSCSKSDVEYAVSQVESTGGGTVYIPAGDCTWNGGYEGIGIDSSVEVSFEGAGNGADPASNTILRNTEGGNFFWYTVYGVHPYWTISNIRFYSDYGCTSGCNNSNIVEVRNSENFRFHHNHVEGYFHNTIQTKSQTKGLIDSNTFINFNTAVLASRYNVGPGSPYDGGPPNPQSHVPPNGLPICDTSVDYGCTCEAGEAASDRSSSVAAGNTVISSVPAVIDHAATSGTGVVQRIYVNIATIGANPTINVASFSRSGDVFTAIARTTGLVVSTGSNIFAVDDEEFTAFDIENGQYIGVYLNNCTLEAHTGSTGWTVAGDQTDQSGVNFGAADIGAVSLWADLYDDDDIIKNCEAAWNGWYNDTTRNGGLYQEWKADWNYGENALYVEDNTITWYSNHTFMNWGGCGKMVVRHNTMTSFRSGVMSWAKPGNNFSIWHDNVFRQTAASPTGYVNWISVNGLVYNNTYWRFSSGMSTEAYKHYSDYFFPFMVRPKELYIWNNTFTDCNCGTTEEDCWYTANEARYWMNLPGDNGAIHLRAPQSGERLYGFTEYTYPHPLRTGDPPPTTTIPGTTTTVSGTTTTVSGTTTTTTTFPGTDEWLTPVSINSACNTSNAGNLIDDDTDSIWHHWSTEQHWIILDMGESYRVTKARKYHNKYGTDYAVSAIYVSENTTDWGSSLGSFPSYYSEETGWKEADLIDKNGRYIKIVSENCISPYWREFQINAETDPLQPPSGLRIIFP